MTRARLGWIVVTLSLLAGLLWLDSNRGGPASELSQCNVGLSRSSAPAADVLVLGSSRTGVAIDSVAMERMLDVAGVESPTVDRIALGRNPLRANVGLLENYLDNRGTPKVIALEISFLTDRSVENIESLGTGQSADAFLFQRDANLLDFGQIAGSSAVARPYTEEESTLNRARFAAEGVLDRTGALVYQFAQDPASGFSDSQCEKADWTREPEWPQEFAFSWDDVEQIAVPSDRIPALRSEIETASAARELRSWQDGVAVGQQYAYDFEAEYREGELALLDTAVELAAAVEVPVVLLPMTLYGTETDVAEMQLLDTRFDGRASVFDVYRETGVDLTTYWYDDAHLEIGVATELTTALLAQHVLDGGWLAEQSNEAAS